MIQSGTFYESLGQKTKELIIQELRYYFQNVSQFGFPGSTVQMPIIREAYGVDLRNYPAVFVKIVHCSPIKLGINQGFVKDVWSDDQEILQQYLPGTENDPQPKSYRRRVIAERYGYMADVSFNLQIWADSTVVRNRLVDEVTAVFMRFQMQDLMNKGILVVSLSEGEETDFPLNDTTHIFVANISLVVNSELYFDYPVDSITDVSVTQAEVPNPNADMPPYILQDQYGEDP